MKNKAGKITINYIVLFLTLSVIPAIMIKSLFFGLDIDEEYAVTLIYRISQGDRILKECFEPHCTSAFLVAVFAKIYLAVKGDIDYFLLFLRLLGMMGNLTVSAYWYLTFRKHFAKEIVCLTALLIFITSPKWIVSPEFAGMEVLFLTAMFCGVAGYVLDGKKRQLIIAGLCAALMVFAYPSTVIIVIVTFASLCVIIDGGRKKNVILYMVPVSICGAAFFVYLLSYMSLNEIVNNVQILLSDGEHQKTLTSKAIDYIAEFGVGLLYCIIYGVAASILTAIVCVFKKMRKNRRWMYFGVTMWIGISCVHQIYCWVVELEPIVHPQYRYLLTEIFAIILLLVFCKKTEKRKKRLLLLSCVLGFTSIISVLILTNLTLKASLVHGVLSLLFAFLIASDTFSNKKGFVYATLIIFILTGIFGRIYLVRMTGGYYGDIFTVRQKTHFGAEKKNYPPYMEGYQYNEDYVWLKDLISDNSKVLYIGNHMMTYLIGEYDICTDSTISTPTFGTNLLTYYAMNPEKKPEYVVTDLMYLEHNSISEEVQSYVTDNYHLIGENIFCKCYATNE